MDKQRILNLTPVSIVMVAYNEEKTIAKVLLEYFREIFVKLPPGSEFIIYLDKPTDCTPKIVRRLARHLPLQVSEGQVNLKYAKAVDRALNLAKNELIFFSDSSGKHRASDFWSLLAKSEGADIVNGLRKSRSDSKIRQFATQIQRRFVSWLFKIPLFDYNTGYKLYRKKALKQLLSASTHVKYTISTEIMIRALNSGLVVREVPVQFVGRKFSQTGTQLWQLLNMGWDSLAGYAKIYFDLYLKK